MGDTCAVAGMVSPAQSPARWGPYKCCFAAHGHAAGLARTSRPPRAKSAPLPGVYEGSHGSGFQPYRLVVDNPLSCR
jgi:hypothetical protein